MNGNPLRDLLGQLSSGQAHTASELASALGVDDDLLKQMLSDLERAGYVQMRQAACESSCQACEFRALCGPMDHGRIWTITEKGLRAARM